MSALHLPQVDVRVYKWPRRITSSTWAYLLGEDEFGHWIGARQGDPWWKADGSQGGVFEQSLVKLIPHDTYWSACFHPVDPMVDVDIVLPATWEGNTLHEVDLELDVLRYADGRVMVRDEDEFEAVRRAWAMPNEVAALARATCHEVFAQVEKRVEPFAAVGRSWLTSFIGR